MRRLLLSSGDMKLLADPDSDFENAAEAASSNGRDFAEMRQKKKEERFLRCGRDLVESQLKTAD